ncbi:HNH endonuclease [Myxococcus llanfairpwllgwyngyllgogerychwyrndrobwllllantysiliogogogochensis]|uniref:HNH endonuclease n=1 Tax=Myxococcus llanfairpwllgwyngyllgogerychwyrndrobwllllantysiliogogogochensis TaxID=2590453 RepID=A0A540X4E2_9BACT|nr:HNH endonuclease [Myxococcus llanfairpwllgwyngyllgogerychwyrndrobwllllantysiliogogogochensis]TQF16110.1 HNH endonuclease [Myxococcus llanfairpwllgwyngyllgogerychwyrndrobwllllantysiliogogogochensis]
MLIDIYSKRSIEERSLEHVIPNFLGGRLTSDCIVDGAVNRHFSAMEAVLAEELRFFTASLDARSHRRPGDHPPSLEVQSVDGEKLVIESGRGIRLVPGPLNVEIVGRKVTITGAPPDEQVVRKALERKLAKAGISFDIEKAMETIRPQIVPRLRPAPAIRSSFNIWHDVPYRVAAKIAFNLLGANEPQLVLGDEFDSIRQFILNGAQPTVHPVEVCSLDLRGSETNPIGELDHLAMVCGDASTREVIGVVTYFGVLSFLIKLADCSLNGDFCYSYRVDQFGRRDRVNGESEARLRVPRFGECSRLSFEEGCDLAIAQVKSLFVDVHRLQLDGWFGSVTERHWAKALSGAPGKELSDEDLQRIIALYVEEITTGLMPRIEAASRRRREEAEVEFFEMLKKRDET